MSLDIGTISPFRELFSATLTGINFDKYEDIPVEATGESCPKNINTFTECNFSEIILANIEVHVHVHVIINILLFYMTMYMYMLS